MVRVGGLTKTELLQELANSGIQLNEIARALFAHRAFTTSAEASTVATVEMSVGELGFVHGATIAQVQEGMLELGLSLCPVELGPHLRLQYLDQAEGHLGSPLLSQRAPPGSITVASAALDDEPGTPRGLYLRCIEGRLWLRGYRSGAEHVWGPEDRFVFRSA